MKGPRLPVTVNTAETLQFNTIDWFDDDIVTPFEDTTDVYYNREHNRAYTIFAFGVTEQGL